MTYYNIGGVVVEDKDKKDDKKDDKKETSKWKECHTGTVEVFKDPKTGISICGGGEFRKVEITPEDLLIDVGIKLDNLIEITNLNGVEKLKKYGNFHIIKINWSDGSDVNLPKEFWEELINVIRKEKRRVVISCVGGHGRTGTVLSILSNLILGEKSPIEFVRKNYCDEAVETSSQINYIEKICNLELDDLPSKLYNSYSTHYGYGNYLSSYYDDWHSKKGGDKEKDNKEEVIDTVVEVKASVDFENLYPNGLPEDLPF